MIYWKTLPENAKIVETENTFTYNGEVIYWNGEEAVNAQQTLKQLAKEANLFTHAQYMSSPNPESHRRYFAQFVNKSVKLYVISRIGLKTILESKDEHFNDICLKQWDNLTYFLPNIQEIRFKTVGDFNSLSNGVCILKEAAKQIKEEANKLSNPETYEP
jgi:hypothetical protein